VQTIQVIRTSKEEPGVPIEAEAALADEET
jgi:hypothetical protein